MNDSNNVLSTRLIRDLADEQKPREKALRNGIKSLSDAELMAIIFSTGIKGKSVIDLCSDILRDNDNHLSRVGRLSIEDFTTRYKGVGIAKAISILAAIELGSRSARDETLLSTKAITSSSDAYKVMLPRFANLPHEEFWVLMLSRSGRYLADRRVSQGGTASTVVDIKILFKELITHLAASFIVVHNHPSGTLLPSTDDDNLTRKIRDAAKTFDITLADHLIITDNGYYSYADNGRL